LAVDNDQLVDGLAQFLDASLELFAHLVTTLAVSFIEARAIGENLL
jgi:hypothetical protein